MNTKQEMSNNFAAYFHHKLLILSSECFAILTKNASIYQTIGTAPTKFKKRLEYLRIKEESSDKGGDKPGENDRMHNSTMLLLVVSME